MDFCNLTLQAGNLSQAVAFVLVMLFLIIGVGLAQIPFDFLANECFFGIDCYIFGRKNI